MCKEEEGAREVGDGVLESEERRLRKGRQDRRGKEEGGRGKAKERLCDAVRGLSHSACVLQWETEAQKA